MLSEKMDANNIGDITQSRSTIISSDFLSPTSISILTIN